jgi:hypothetical protein
MAHPRRIRWYNPRLNTFEWREVPESDEEALSLLVGSPYSPITTETYREWRKLGASSKRRSLGRARRPGKIEYGSLVPFFEVFIGDSLYLLRISCTGEVGDHRRVCTTEGDDARVFSQI